MIFVRCWTRDSLRHRWRSLLGIALLLGIIGGLSLFTLAGARRTQSSYPRFLRAANPSTLAVDIGGLWQDGGVEGMAAVDQISQFPQVVRARGYMSFYVAEMDDGHPDLSKDFEVIGSVDGRYFDQDVFTPVDGRAPDPARSDEVAVNEESARRFGYVVGQQVDLGTFSPADVQGDDGSDPDALVPRLLTHARIVGVGVFVEEVVQDDTDRSPLMLLTPAYVREARGLETYEWLGLVLRDGDSDTAAVEHTIDALSDPGSPQLYRETAIQVFHTQQAVRPIALALATFGAITGIAAVVLVGQALSRHVRADFERDAVARALGASPRALALASWIGPAIAIVGGCVMASAIAAAASPAMPLGRVRRVLGPGAFDFDWTVLGAGCAALALVLLAWAGVSAWLSGPHRRVRARASTRARAGTAITRAIGLPVPAATGVRLAFDPGPGPASVPVRSVLVGAAIAVASLVAAMTFGASLGHLVSNPRLAGWNWDVALVDSAGYGNTNPVATDEILGPDPDIEAWSGAFFGADVLDGVRIPLLGMDPTSSVTPQIREGRMIRRPGEVVLGTASLAGLGKRVGDSVDSTSGRLLIVGSTTLPSIGLVHGDHVSLGVGGIVVPTAVPGFDRNTGNPTGTPLPDTYGPNVLFVRYVPGADAAAVTKRLQSSSQGLADYGGVKVTTVRPRRRDRQRRRHRWNLDPARARHRTVGHGGAHRGARRHGAPPPTRPRAVQGHRVHPQATRCDRRVAVDEHDDRRSHRRRAPRSRPRATAVGALRSSTRCRRRAGRPHGSDRARSRRRARRRERDRRLAGATRPPRPGQHCPTSRLTVLRRGLGPARLHLRGR